MASLIPSFAVKPTLVGERVLLRPVAAGDAAGLVEILNDPEVRRLTGTHSQASSGAELERAEQWYSSRAGYDNRLDLAIVEQRTNSYVGEVVLNELDADNRSCSFRIALVGPRVFGRGYGTEATRLVLSHAFGAVGVHRVTLEVFAFNPAGPACLRAGRLRPRRYEASGVALAGRLGRRSPHGAPRRRLVGASRVSQAQRLASPQRQYRWLALEVSLHPCRTTDGGATVDCGPTIGSGWSVGFFEAEHSVATGARELHVCLGRVDALLIGVHL